MAIKVGTPESREFTTLPERKYEVFVDKYDTPDVGTDGNETSRIMFRVRKDVDPDFGGNVIFTNINTAWAWLINGLSRAVGIAPDTEYSNLADFLADIKGKSLVVKVRHKVNPRDASKVFVNITDFYPSVLPAYVPDVADGADTVVSDTDVI